MKKKICITLLLVTLLTFLVSAISYGATYTEPTALLRKGSYGTSVKWLQTMLNSNGYNLVVDGSFGTKTYNAVISFQKSRGLAVDGIVGYNTRTALKKVTNKLPTFQRTNSYLLNIIKACKSYYANNNFSYSTAAGVRSIPADKSVKYGNSYYTDCSTYVSWTLYEYARANGNTKMRDCFSTQKTSSNYASIGANGGNTYLKVVSKKTSNSNVNMSYAKAGDILVTSGHVEFLSSYTRGTGNTITIKVYNCGSNASLKVNGITTSGTKNIGDILYILRVR